MKSPNIIIESDSFILIQVLQSPFTRHLVLEVNDIVETDKAAPGGNNFVGVQLVQLLISWQEMPIPDLVFFLPPCLMMLRHSICGKSRCSRAGWLPRRRDNSICAQIARGVQKLTVEHAAMKGMLGS